MRTSRAMGLHTTARTRHWLGVLLGAALLTVTAYQLLPLIDFVPRSAEYVTLSREYHLARRWKAYDYFNRTLAIVAQTPPDALIVLPAQSNRYGPLGNAGLTDYFVFPRQVANANESQIETFQGPVYQVVAQPDSGDVTLVQIRARRAASPLIERDFILIPRALVPLALAVLKFGLVVLSGLWFVRRWFQLKTVPGVLAASALLGMTLNAVIFVLLAFANIPATEFVQFAILLLLALPSLWNLTRQHPRIALPQTRAERAAAAVALGPLALIFFLAISKPLVEWDALAIWGIKARVVFAAQTLRALGLWGAYPEYPPLVPIAMSQLGIGGELAVKALFPMFAWCLYGVVYEGLEFGGWARWLAPLPLLLAPQIGEQSGNGYANIALAAYATLAVVLFARWVKSQTRAAAFATGLTLCGLALVRPEGEMYVLFVLLLALLVFWKFAALKRTVFWFALPVAIDALWKVFFTLYLRNATGSAFGVASQGQLFLKAVLTSRPPRALLLPTLQNLVAYSFGLSLWGLIPIAFVGMLALRPREFYMRYAAELAFLILSGAALVLFALYVVPRWGMDYFFNAGYARYYLTLVPLMYVLTVNVFATQFTSVAQTRTTLVPA